MGNNGKYSESIREFIIENFLFGDGKELSTDTRLFEKGIIDSTGILELVAFIEDRFNISITDDELIVANFLTLSAIDSFLQTKINNQ
jgi:acyl carrier protein